MDKDRSNRIKSLANSILPQIVYEIGLAIMKADKRIMARWTYAFSNGSYNDWHRKYEGIAMIDIDSIECCPRCYEPLAILETCYDKSQKFKATTLSKIVASRLNIPCFLVFYKK